MGKIPWNKGKKCPTMSEPRKGKHYSQKTEFKKGNVGVMAAAWKGGSRPWCIQQARNIFEEAYGIPWEEMNKPKDTVIHHIDNNMRNNTFNNLCVMSRSDHMYLHNELRKLN